MYTKKCNGILLKYWQRY